MIDTLPLPLFAAYSLFVRRFIAIKDGFFPTRIVLMTRTVPIADPFPTVDALPYAARRQRLFVRYIWMLRLQVVIKR
ncbi:hypothetical protein [Paenibacillus cymbidii]|uniref:hypothetical protein n=1 Tax=Paenibacillus cymbidii TaxID=1639034 RepID=UPI001F401967|nr:hypothetical protein [Paenibacillus cymbidii]